MYKNIDDMTNTAIELAKLGDWCLMQTFIPETLDLVFEDVFDWNDLRVILKHKLIKLSKRFDRTPDC